MTLEAFLAANARNFGFGYGVQSTAEVASRLETEGHNLAERVLTPAEFDVFARLWVPKRRVEWLAGRLAAKAAFAHHRQLVAPDGQTLPTVGVPALSVLNRPSRAPFIQGHPELYVSISHAGEHAVAVIASFPIGVDIEAIEPRPALFADFYLCQQERDGLQVPNPSSTPGPMQAHEAGPAAQAEVDAQITRLWSRKEAVAKLLQVGGAIPFKGIDVSGDVATVIGDDSAANVRLVSGRYDGYWLSLAMQVPCPGDGL